MVVIRGSRQSIKSNITGSTHQNILENQSKGQKAEKQENLSLCRAESASGSRYQSVSAKRLVALTVHG